jgi:hypothetical protein
MFCEYQAECLVYTIVNKAAISLTTHGVPLEIAHKIAEESFSEIVGKAVSKKGFIKGPPKPRVKKADIIKDSLDAFRKRYESVNWKLFDVQYNIYYCDDFELPGGRYPVSDSSYTVYTTCTPTGENIGLTAADKVQLANKGLRTI